MNLPGYSPDFNADEAIWGWAREEATGNLCLGSRAAVQERVGKFLAVRAVQPERRGETALPDGPAIKGRNTPARLPPRFPAPGKCTSHLGFGLVSGRFYVSKTIIPEAQEHFLTHSTRRHTYLVGGLGLSERDN